MLWLLVAVCAPLGYIVFATYSTSLFGSHVLNFSYQLRALHVYPEFTSS